MLLGHNIFFLNKCVAKLIYEYILKPSLPPPQPLLMFISGVQTTMNSFCCYDFSFTKITKINKKHEL